MPETSLPLAHTLRLCPSLSGMFTSKRPSVGLGSRKNLETVKRLLLLEFPTISLDPHPRPAPQSGQHHAQKQNG